MKPLNTLFENYKPQPTQFKSRRDEILSEYIGDINAKRKQAGYAPISKRWLNIKLNKNPHLAGKENDGEVELLLRQCRERGSYSKMFYVIK